MVRTLQLAGTQVWIGDDVLAAPARSPGRRASVPRGVEGEGGRQVIRSLKAGVNLKEVLIHALKERCPREPPMAPRTPRRLVAEGLSPNGRKTNWRARDADSAAGLRSGNCGFF